MKLCRQNESAYVQCGCSRSRYVQSDVCLGEVFAEDEWTFTVCEDFLHSVKILEEVCNALVICFLRRSESSLGHKICQSQSVVHILL